MFYSKFLFVKKGPLSKIWLSACQRKLSKVQISETDIIESVDSIQNPEAPLALRLSGQLLLGLVRIYQRKIRYLQDDLSDALSKMKVGVQYNNKIDLPTDHMIAPMHAITLTENLDCVDFDLDLPFDESIFDVQNNNVFLEDDNGDEYKQLSFSQTQTDMYKHSQSIDNELKESMSYADISIDVPRGAINESKSVIEDPEVPLDISRNNADNSFIEPNANLKDNDFDLYNQPEAPIFDENYEIPLGDDFTILPLEQQQQQQLEGENGNEMNHEESQKKTKKRKPKKRRRIAKITEVTELSKRDIEEHLGNREEISCRNDYVPVNSNMNRGNMIELDTTSFLDSLPDNIKSIFERAQAIEIIVEEDEDMTNIPENQGVDGGLDSNIDLYNQPEAPIQEDMDVLPDLPSMSFDESMQQINNELMNTTNSNDLLNDNINTDDILMAEDEEEEIEPQENGWSNRTQKMYQFLNNYYESNESLSYDAATKGRNRQVAAGMFHELLVLASHDYITVEQEEVFGDITVKPSDNFVVN